MADESGLFKGLLISFLLFGLFGFLILTTIIDVAPEYDKNTSDVFTESLNIEKYESYLVNAKNTSEERKTKFQDSSPFSQFVEIVASGIWYVALGFLSIIFVPFDMLNGVIFLIVGNNALANIISGSLLSILIITVVFGIWRVLKAGD